MIEKQNWILETIRRNRRLTLVVFHRVCPRLPRRIARQVAELQEHSKHDWKKESLFVPAQVFGIEKIPMQIIQNPHFYIKIYMQNPHF